MIVQVKYNRDGKYHLEAYGFKSLPFPLRDMKENRQLFIKLINLPVVGTIQ